MVRLVAMRLRLGSVGRNAAAVAASTNTRRAMVFNDDLLRPVFAARSCLLSTYKPRKALLRTCYLDVSEGLSGLSAAVGGAVEGCSKPESR